MRLLLVALLLALAAASASAHPESAAPALNPLVVRAWHDPEPVAAGTQWSGFLQLRDGHAVGKVWYQICNAGDGVCFAARHAAHDVGNDTYRFDTQDYLANGRPVHYEAGWRVGVRWFLADTAAPDSNGTWLPRTPPSPTEVVPIEDLYLTFDIPGGAERGAPGPALGTIAVALFAASAFALAARRRP